MSKLTKRSPMVRRLWKPVAVTGAGGIAVTFLFEDILLFGEEILALISLSIMGGVIYLVDFFIFNSCTIRREDIKDPKETGVKK